MLAVETLAGGFAEPVFEAQAVFRALMDGFARPGTVGMAVNAVRPPASLGKASASVLLAMCDFETKVWLSGSLLQDPTAQGWIHFHSGAPLTESVSAAAFAFAASPEELPRLGEFSPGTDEYPDTSTTVVLEVESLENGAQLVLQGPGINGSKSISPEGLPANFLVEWDRNGMLFPCGVDLILTAGDQFVCLPRTTRIREA